jgi:hypothetical protein
MVAKVMPLMEELRNGLNLDGVSYDFGVWHIQTEVAIDFG